MSEPISEDTIPRLCEGVDLACVALAQEEGVFATRIDGQTRFVDLCTITGLGPDAAREMLTRLAASGVVCWETPQAAPRQRPVAAREPRQPAVRTRQAGRRPPASAKTTAPRRPSRSPRRAAPGDETPLDPAALQEPGELDRESRELILRKHAALATQNHYEFLEIGREARPGEIKRAYHARAGVFHPDRFFRRDLGSFQSRLEEICQRLREAQATLLDERQRRIYDDQVFVAPKLKAKAARRKARRKARGKKGPARARSSHPVMQKVNKAREYHQAALAARAEGDILGADANLKLAIANDPQNEDYLNLSRALRGEVERQKAVGEFRRAEEHELRGEMEEAQNTLRRCVDMDPENAEYLHRLVTFLAEYGGDLAEMVALARRAVFRSGKKPEYRQTLAQLLENQGEREAAIGEYRELLEHESTVDFAIERLNALGEKVKKPKKKKKKRGFF